VIGVDDVARFAADDVDALVAAVLACPYCLGRPAHVLVDDHAHAARAVCGCELCAAQWTVALHPEQALRLVVAPARDLWVQYAFRGAG
jgi:hypothetical protein